MGLQGLQSLHVRQNRVRVVRHSRGGAVARHAEDARGGDVRGEEVVAGWKVPRRVFEGLVEQTVRGVEVVGEVLDVGENHDGHRGPKDGPRVQMAVRLQMIRDLHVPVGPQRKDVPGLVVQGSQRNPKRERFG